MDSYRVPAGRATATVTEKKSEFIAHLAPVESEDAALAFLDEVRSAHRTARHNVYAYVLREGARSRYSDDGEPAKTAGLPVLSAIGHAHLTNCVIVVTRYFGGVLLGTGGLVRAYTAAATAAIQRAGTCTVRAVRTISLTLPYALYEAARRILDDAGAKFPCEPHFGAEVNLSAVLPDASAEAAALRLRELLRGGAGIALGAVYFAPF